MDTIYPGAAAPPEGMSVNLDSPQDVLRTVNFVTQGLTLAFVSIFVALRSYAKLKVLGGSFGFEDYATLIAYLMMIGYCTCGIFLSVHGGGLNQWEVRKGELEPFLKSAYAVTIHYAPMALFCKLALLLLIARVFGSVYKKTIQGIYVFMGMLVAYYVAGLVIKIRICSPISAYWHSEYGKCLDQSAIITADSILSVISDLAILLLPTPLTWSLNMPNKKKLRVIGVLCAGGLATAFSIYRLGVIIAEGKSSNQTIVFVKVVLSGNAEAGIGIICACLPAVNALIIRRKQRYMYSATHTRNYGPSRANETAAGTRIYVKHDFHLESTPRVEKEVGDNAFELHSDDSQLVANAQADPKDSWSTKSA
ncbi:hypothetical protein JX265_013198 [Neoarthrinium moseri]|uniref:Rhodopsin domain-containing protein n=1 Tax=Neoarthrinium moseri TaxID=1658444 RepID=A0A9P9W8Y1_9PEZI|nr:hypothetical protein JX266_012690 [Neoarthrinium moseri]KAI1851451.1 hypothetical protein JX265_013198 [Neoarthrinium moseri]